MKHFQYIFTNNIILAEHVLLLYYIIKSYYFFQLKIFNLFAIQATPFIHFNDF
jgi:hypothetical protein